MKGFIRVDVTKSDIARGVAGSSVSCPVALSLRRIFGEEILVNNFSVWFYLSNNGGGSINVGLPPKVSNFIGAWDNHRKVKPFSFYLPLSAE